MGGEIGTEDKDRQGRKAYLLEHCSGVKLGQRLITGSVKTTRDPWVHISSIDIAPAERNKLMLMLTTQRAVEGQWPNVVGVLLP